VDGRNRWQWVFETEQASYHVIVPTRGSQTIEQVLGDAQPQVWISDCFSVQLKAPPKERQLCLAHQLRDLRYGIEADRCGFCYGMQQLLRRAMRLAKHRPALGPQIFAVQLQEIKAGCERALRNSVVHHKVSGGFRSVWDAEAFATLTSVLQTNHKHGKGPLTALTSLLGPPLALEVLTQAP